LLPNPSLPPVALPGVDALLPVIESMGLVAPALAETPPVPALPGPIPENGLTLEASDGVSLLHPPAATTGPAAAKRKHAETRDRRYERERRGEEIFMGARSKRSAASFQMAEPPS
jgi:hypothetical protein